MSYFAALLTRSGSTWSVGEAELAGCESLGDIADVLRDEAGDVRLVLIEQDDEYAAIVRLDEDDEDGRAFLSDGHAADSYALAGYLAEDLGDDDETVDEDSEPVEDDEENSDDDLVDGAPPAHEAAPLGDPAIVDDLGTGATELLALCAHEGTLPIDVLVAVCEKAGCGPEFDDLRG